jgi:hypothetical protein
MNEATVSTALGAATVDAAKEATASVALGTAAADAAMKAMVSATPRAAAADAAKEAAVGADVADARADVAASSASSAAVKEAATVSSFVSLVIETAKNKEVAGSEGREEELDPTAKGGDSCEVSGDFTRLFQGRCACMAHSYAYFLLIT